MMLFPRDEHPRQDLHDLSAFVSGGVPESAHVRDLSGKDPWKKLDDETLQKLIAPNLGMPYGTTTPQEAQYTEKATADAARDWYVPQATWGAGLMAAGSSLPLPPVARMGALAAGFALTPSDAQALPGGPKSKTANLGALAQAQEMFQAGKSASQIKAYTGWYRSGADGSWKYQIPDDKSRWITDPREITGPVKMGDVYHHPEAYAAYPELANTELNVGSIAGARGSYQSGMGVDKPIISLSPSTPQMMRSTNLHELTHGVQDIEDFATGGSTWGGLRRGTPEWKLYQERLEAIKTPMTEKEFDRLGIGGDGFTYKEYLKQHHDGLRKPGAWQTLDRMAQETAVRQGYDRSAGEVEARLTQKYADLTPEQLAATRPWVDQDVPYEDQVVKFRQKMGSLADRTSYAIDPKLWSPLSKEKLRVPLDELEHGVTINRTPVPKIVSPEELLGGYGLFTPWDLSRTNATVDKIGGVKLQRPVTAHGGVGFPEANPGMAAASDTAIARRLDNTATRLSETGKPVYIMPITMGPQGIDASHHIADPLAQMVQEAPITRKDAKAFNEAMQKFQEEKRGKRSKDEVPDWLSINSPNFPKYISGMRGGMTTKAMMAEKMAQTGWQDKGFPNVAAVRHAMSEPGLWNYPTDTFGMAISRYIPGQGLLDTTHPSYAKGVAGQHMGQLASLVPFKEGAYDIAGPLAEKNAANFAIGKKVAIRPAYHFGKPDPKIPVAQYFDEQWVERMMKRMEKAKDR